MDRYTANLLRATIIVAIIGLAWSGTSIAVDHLRSRRSLPVPPGMEVVRGVRPEEIEPRMYDPSRELRIAVSEVSGDGHLFPMVIILRGPWSFGVAEIDRVALALGPPTRRGAGYLLYYLNQGKMQVTVLFNAARLHTIVVEPLPCGPDQSACERPYAWSLTAEQVRDEDLQRLELSGAAMLAARGRGFYYRADPAPAVAGQYAVGGVYVQQLSRNPLLVRGLEEPGSRARTERTANLTEREYMRLLGSLGHSLLLQERDLGREHNSIQYLRFELGRVQLEAGQAAVGRETVHAAAAVLRGRLGADHPDVKGMEAWGAAPSSRP